MKKYLFFISILFSVSLIAQIENGNFEKWPSLLEPSSHEGDLQKLGVENVWRGVPAGWELSHFPFGVCRSNDHCNGNFALLLFAWYHGVETGVKKTFPIAYRPHALSGCYKYLFFDEALDEADCYVDLLFFKGKDTIATAHYSFDTTSSYRNFTHPIDYRSELIPDSVAIRIYSGVLSSANYPADGLLFLDDLKLETLTTNNQDLVPASQFSIHPNPFADRFFIDCPQSGPFHYELYNLKGELLQKDSLQAARNSLEVSHLPEGVYLLKIVGEGEECLVKKIIKNQH